MVCLFYGMIHVYIEHNISLSVSLSVSVCLCVHACVYLNTCVCLSQIIEINGQNFENISYSKAMDIIRNNTHLSLTVKTNIFGM